MALSGDEWLEQHFFPVVDSLPSVDKVDPTSRETAFAAFVAFRLLGAVDALAQVGVLDDEQEERCRSVLAQKGVTTSRERHVAVRSFHTLATGTVVVGEEAEREPQEPDRLVRVLGSGQVFGLVDGEEAVLVCVEVWQRTVRASLLLAVSPEAEHARRERARELQEWLAKRHAGEIAAGEHPPMASRLSHPGAATTWLLDAAGRPVEGRVVQGNGGTTWWRVDVEWPLAVPEDCRELDISATEDGRVIGRATISW